MEKYVAVLRNNGLKFNYFLHLKAQKGLMWYKAR